MELSDRVRLKRKELGLTQEELAIRMGYKSRVSINKIEMGRPITQKIIIKLAKALNTTPAYLMGWEEKPKTEEEMIQYFDDTIDTSALQSEVFRIEVGLRIKNARENKNMSMKTLGEKVNLHESTVSRYENGEIQVLDVEKMKEFADALDISASYLMGWEKEDKDNTAIGQKLLSLRETRNLSREELANEFHISVEDLKAYENGSKRIPQYIIDLYKTKFGDDVLLIENESTTILTKNARLGERLNLWESEIGYQGKFSDKQISFFIEFGKMFSKNELTDTDIDELINFAKYLVSKRKKDGEK